MTIHSTWQNALSTAITTISELSEMLQIDLGESPLAHQVPQSFALRVPRAFVSRMEKNNLHDPLLLQVLPQENEIQETPGFTRDPLQEIEKNPVPGLLHKYPNRVLMTLTGACAIHCRYCFRRYFPYENNLPSRLNWDRALNYIAQDNNIEEVILSGGDPLVLKDHLLSELVSQLENISHLKRLRIHTRLPIVIPERVTAEWIAWMQQSRFQMIVVVHCNHANEIDEPVLHALKKLHDASITVLNQSVLLKNINDNADALVQLSKRLFQAGVLPYYLHLLDTVSGSAHFDVCEENANHLLSEIKKQLPGYLVPKLAREVSGQLHKTF